MAHAVSANVRPKVSIGFPVYNGEASMRRALDSLLGQDFTDFELVISDNASTDQTRRIGEEYADRDARVRFDRSERNVGAVGNFKRVLDLARGEYFMWAARDDAWCPGFVAALVRELDAHPEAGVAMTAVDRVFEDGALHDRIRFVGDDDPNRKDHAALIAATLSPLKYNLYVYGLFRADLLRKATAICPDLPAWDRWLVLVVAFASRFRYVDEVLHVRTVYRGARKSQLKDGVRAELGLGPTLARMLWRADFAPRAHRLMIPQILLQFAVRRTLPAVPRAAYDWLRGFFSIEESA